MERILKNGWILLLLATLYSCSKNELQGNDCIKVRVAADACDGVLALQLVNPQDYHLGSSWTYRGQSYDHIISVKNYCAFISDLGQQLPREDWEGSEFYINLVSSDDREPDCYVCLEAVPKPQKEYFVKMGMCGGE